MGSRSRLGNTTKSSLNWGVCLERVLALYLSVISSLSIHISERALML